MIAQSMNRNDPVSRLVSPLNDYLYNLKINRVWFANLVCSMIPSQCPFERDIKFLGFGFHIPPMCKLNPVYDGLVGLRFHSLEYLTSNQIDVEKFI